MICCIACSRGRISTSQENHSPRVRYSFMTSQQNSIQTCQKNLHLISWGTTAFQMCMTDNFRRTCHVYISHKRNRRETFQRQTEAWFLIQNMHICDRRFTMITKIISIAGTDNQIRQNTPIRFLVFHIIGGAQRTAIIRV